MISSRSRRTNCSRSGRDQRIRRFAVDERDIDDVVRTLIALEGVPLAIEIAASQLRSTSIARLAAAVEHDSTTLQLSQRDTAERHRSVAAAFRSSLETVAAIDREVLEGLECVPRLRPRHRPRRHAARRRRRLVGSSARCVARRPRRRRAFPAARTSPAAGRTAIARTREPGSRFDNVWPPTCGF